MKKAFAAVLASFLLLPPALFSEPKSRFLSQRFDGILVRPRLKQHNLAPTGKIHISQESNWNWPKFLAAAVVLEGGRRLLKLPNRPIAASATAVMAGADVPWWMLAGMTALDFTARRWRPKNILGRFALRVPYFALAASGAYLSAESFASRPNRASFAYPADQRKPLNVAFIGDSLSKNFRTSNPLHIAWQIRNNNQYDWVLDTDSSESGILSLSERIARITPISMHHYAKIGACVDYTNIPDGSLGYKACKVQCLSSQVSQVLSQKEFPDLIILWIGNNNVDWALGATQKEKNDPEARLEEIAESVKKSYRAQLDRLITASEEQNKKTAIVIMGLINFESFFRAREEAEAIKAANPDTYPHLETDYDYFESIKPQYRKNMIILATKINIALQELAEEAPASANLHVTYSGAMSSLKVTLPMLSEADAWHASVEGHNKMAQALFSDLQKARRGYRNSQRGVFDFLGVPR